MARPRIPVVYNGRYWPSARSILMRLGISQYQQQKIRDELTKGCGMVQLRGRFLVRADLA